MQLIMRGNREVSLLVADLVSQASFSLFGRIPVSFSGVYLVKGPVLGLLIRDMIKYKELGLGAEKGGISDSRRPEIIKSLERDVPGIFLIPCSANGINDITEKTHCAMIKERVNKGGTWIGPHQHVTLVD